MNQHNARITVEVDEKVCERPPGNTGADQFWCWGSSTITRLEDSVYISVFDSSPDKKPYMNVRWQILERTGDGQWQLFDQARDYEQREPCPIAAIPPHTLVLSNNPEVNDEDDIAWYKHQSAGDQVTVVQVISPATNRTKIDGPHADRSAPAGYETPALREHPQPTRATCTHNGRQYDATARFWAVQPHCCRSVLPAAVNHGRRTDGPRGMVQPCWADAQRLYATWTVSDPSPAYNPHTKVDQLWQGDCVELYVSSLDGSLDWRSGHLCVYIPADGDAKQPRTPALLDKASGTWTTIDDATVITQRHADGTGYELTCTLPLKAIGLEHIEPGCRFLLDWALCYENNGAFSFKLYRVSQPNNGITRTPLLWGEAHCIADPEDMLRTKWEQVRPGVVATGKLPPPVQKDVPTGGICKPEVLVFDTRNSSAAPRKLVPGYPDLSLFTEHSYRGMGVDADTVSMLLVNQDSANNDYPQAVSWRSPDGIWHDLGRIYYPIRGCYPSVVVRNGAGYVLSVGDVREPIEQWRQVKWKHLENTWDYVFRRLFLTWTPVLGEQDFCDPIEIVNVDERPGSVRAHDIYVADDGTVHVICLTRRFQYDFLRDELWPEEADRCDVRYYVVRDGRVVDQQVVYSVVQERRDDTWQWPGIVPAWLRLHADAQGRLAIVMTAATDSASFDNCRLYIIQQHEDEQWEHPEPIRISSERLYGIFHTSNQRCGVPAGDVIDILVQDCSHHQSDDDPQVVLHYVRVRR